MAANMYIIYAYASPSIGTNSICNKKLLRQSHPLTMQPNSTMSTCRWAMRLCASACAHMRARFHVKVKTCEKFEDRALRIGPVDPDGADDVTHLDEGEELIYRLQVLAQDCIHTIPTEPDAEGHENVPQHSWTLPAKAEPLEESVDTLQSTCQ